MGIEYRVEFMDQFSQSKRGDEHDFESIENAVLETPRGRWFLAEYARRNHQSDTEFLLMSINRLENLLARKTASPDTQELLIATAKVLDMIETINQTIAIDHDALTPSDHPLKGVALAAEDINAEISLAADMIRDFADAMKSKKSPSELLEEITRQASLIIDLGGRQSRIINHVKAIIELQRVVESTLSAMIEGSLPSVTAENDNLAINEA